MLVLREEPFIVYFIVFLLQNVKHFDPLTDKKSTVKKACHKLFGKVTDIKS